MVQIGRTYMCGVGNEVEATWRVMIANLPDAERDARHRDMELSRLALVEEVGGHVRPCLVCSIHTD